MPTSPGSRSRTPSRASRRVREDRRRSSYFPATRTRTLRRGTQLLRRSRQGFAARSTRASASHRPSGAGRWHGRYSPGFDDPLCVDGVDGVVELPPLPPMFGQSPWAVDPPLAAYIGGAADDAAGRPAAPLAAYTGGAAADPGGERAPLDPEPPAAIATVAQTAAATITARTANQ